MIICATFGLALIISVVLEPVGRSWYSGAESWPFHSKVPETQDEGNSLLGGSVCSCAGNGSSVLRPVLHKSDWHIHQLPQPSAGRRPHHFMCSPGMIQCCSAQAKTLEACCGVGLPIAGSLCVLDVSVNRASVPSHNPMLMLFARCMFLAWIGNMLLHLYCICMFCTMR